MAKPPSSTLLSILAIIASPTVNAAPPTFLCPSLIYKPSPTTTLPRRIPHKFVQGDDGRWRKVDSYTLYGSTVLYIGACLYPTQIPPHSYDEVRVSAGPPTSTPTEDIRDSLPLGWQPTSKPSENRTTLILSLSLVLAFFICFFTIGCLFWRKSVIRQRKRDLEAEFKKHLPSAEEEAKEKETKAKQKLFARATARWRANARHAARQRKGKRVTTLKSSQADPPPQSSNNSRSRTPLPVSSPPSRASSRRSSVISLPDQSIIGESLTSQSHDTLPIVATSPHTNVPISPPAYHHGGQASPIIHPNISHATPLDRSRRPSQSSSPRIGIDPYSSGISTPKPFHAAHVATDDKALLARLADSASRPPEDVSTDTLDTLVSAPAWHDELEDVPLDLVTPDDHPPDITCVPSPLFPPPPSKERMATADLYDYSFSFSFEDMASLGPVPEPSAPPFQLDSALPLEDQVVPSAPPLTDDPELIHPTAPQWESTSCQPDAGEEIPTRQDHDRTTSTVARLRLPPSANVQASRQEIGTVDDVALPGYRP